MIRDTGHARNHHFRAGGSRVVTGKARSQRVVTTITTVTTRGKAYTRVRAHARARMSSNPSTGGNGGSHPTSAVTNAKNGNHQGGNEAPTSGNQGGSRTLEVQA